VPLAPLEHQEMLEQVVRRERQVLMVLQELLEQQDHKDLQDGLVHQVPQAQPVRAEELAERDHLD